MKIRAGFVTNSSSSSYIVLSLTEDIIEEIFKKEDITEDSDLWRHVFKAKNIEAVREDGEIRWLGYILQEQDLRRKTLNQIEIELVDEINQAYGLGITIDDIYFDYGEIYD